MVGCCKCTLIILPVLVGILAYLAYVPLPPEDFSGHGALAIELAITNAIENVAWFAETIGYGYPKTSRGIASVLMGLLPVISDESIHFEDTIFDGIPVRVYIPTQRQKPTRAVVYFHGGGFIIGDVDMYHSQVFRIAKELNAVTVSVNYRTGPEHVFPTALRDSEKAARFFLQHLSDYDVDPGRVALMGDSAGGNLATTVSRRLTVAKFKPAPKLQVLLFPSTQMVNNDLPSYRYNQHGPIITKLQASYFSSWYGLGHLKYREILLNNSHISLENRKAIKYIMDINLLPDDEIKRAYTLKDYHDAKLPQEVQKTFLDPDISPLLADEKELIGMPMAYMVSCQYDILRDEQLLYVVRLKKVGVKVLHEHMRVCVHGWTFMHETSFSKEFSAMLATVDKNL